MGPLMSGQCLEVGGLEVEEVEKNEPASEVLKSLRMKAA